MAMTSLPAQLRRWLFGVAPRETRISARGFDVSDQRVKSRIEAIGETFMAGYHAALLQTAPERLAEELHRIDPELRGFAYEGAGMGLTLADVFAPGKHYWRDFLAGPGEPHSYMLHVGAGWARARLPFNPEAALKKMDPLLGWLALDGYGFHQGYFYWRRFIDGQKIPPKLSPYGRRAFDQGLGRCLWFVKGANPARIAETVNSFALERRDGLWSGAGLAATYAGGVNAEILQELQELAREFRPQLAQGAAFAAKARLRASNATEHTELACGIFCGLSAAEAAEATDLALRDLPPGDAGRPAYQYWRENIQARFA